MNEHIGADELIAPELLKFRRKSIAGGERFGFDDDLSEERILKLLIERKIETDRALTDVGTPSRNFRIAFEAFLKPVHLAPCFGNRTCLRQGQVDQDFGLLLHIPHAED